MCFELARLGRQTRQAAVQLAEYADRVTILVRGQGLTATLTGATGTAGTATFTPGSTSGTNTLVVSVSGLAVASQSLTV